MDIRVRAVAPFYAVLRQLHKEPLAILLVVLALLAITRALSGGRRRHILGAGVALGALTLVRLEYGWVLVAVLAIAAVWWTGSRKCAVARRLAAIAAVGLAVCLPWLGYTYSLTGKPLYWGATRATWRPTLRASSSSRR